ncbi:ABC transporter I family member 6, chloroplastic isoform X1 [Phalaenopsis equestris]|uniref:ABC transporter I family member 6, chloroplastic isoform X1 n=1 Tax=Phalaenopsis equestris TaxID=78828 RepID=UPI0009E5B04D|nr:ABC transporter I family member 6, chloroplastic isoform X1 [Phalaenopsis equestris]XP_020580106.1 ABC transporter I family member 6, chloroplastic isoform X1 [Phalaenopsis equestris]
MTARLCFSSLTPLPNLPSVSSSSSSTKVFPISKSLEIQPRFRFRSADRRSHRTYATLTVDSQISGEKTMETAPPGILLEVKNLTAIVAESKQEILRGVNLTINEGEVHAIMGKNGSGKSTFSKVLVGHPDYEVTGGTVSFKGEDLLKMEPETRSHAGLFMSFQTPVEIPGVSNMDFLLMACNARREKRGEPALSPIEFFGFLSPKLAAVNMNPKFLDRNVNEGFSGGEKKRNEILQLAVLEAELAILDEIDSGLDVDALQDVAKAINGLLTPHNSILMITHYQRLLDYIKPNYVHIMEAGAIVRTGDSSLAKRLEKEGYRAISAA